MSKVISSCFLILWNILYRHLIFDAFVECFWKSFIVEDDHFVKYARIRVFKDFYTLVYHESNRSSHTCSHKTVFWKHAANLQENTHVEMWFRQNCKAALLKSHFSISVLLSIWRLFSKHIFTRTAMEGCFWTNFMYIFQLNLCTRKIEKKIFFFVIAIYQA